MASLNYRSLKRDAAKAALILFVYILFGPVFGFLAFSIITEFGRGLWAGMDIKLALMGCLIAYPVGIIQATLVANAATASFEAYGFVSLRKTMEKAFRVALIAAILFFAIFASKSGILTDFQWAIYTSAIFAAIHLIAALGCWLVVSRIRVHRDSGWSVN